MENVRHQLSLFVPAENSGPLEAARRVLDPVQFGRIAAHVTLCREDELVQLNDEILRARARVGRSVALTFGAPERFSSHGIVLPCVSGVEAFQELRRQMLGVPNARQHEPHITLAHPRNPKAPGNNNDGLSLVGPGLSFRFAAVALIRQEGASPWRIENHYELLG